MKSSIQIPKGLPFASVALAAGIGFGMAVSGNAAAIGEVHYNDGGTNPATSSLFVYDNASQLLDLKGGKLTVNGGDNSGGSSYDHLPGLDWRRDGRIDMGWYGDGGGNLEAYSKGHPTRAGQFKFVYGGGANMGRVQFDHYNGSGWVTNMILWPTGDLQIRGKLESTEVLVRTDIQWPDYVFEDGYPLMPLDELDEFVRNNRHLPGVPTQKDVSDNGVNLGDVSAQLLRKVEELTLYMIELKKQNDYLHDKVVAMEEHY